MNSSKTFAKPTPSSLLKNAFIEYGEVTKNPSQLMFNGESYILKEKSKELFFGSEDEVVDYLRSEIRKHDSEDTEM